MLRALLPAARPWCCTRNANPRALPPATLAVAGAAAAGDARRRGARARSARRACAARASWPGPDGAVLATGSIYLVADLLRAPGGAPRVDAVNDGRPAVPPDDRARRGRRGARRSSSSSRSATGSAGCSCDIESPRCRRPTPSLARLWTDAARRSSASTTTASTGRQPADPRPGRRLAGADLLDVRRRPPAHRDPMLVGCATAASLFPFVGTIVYMIVRPPEYLDDVRERELEMQAAEARLHAARLPALPALRLRGRARLPALPELPAQAQGRRARTARKPLDPHVEDLPVLRGRDRSRARRAAGAAGARREAQPTRAAVAVAPGIRRPRRHLMDRTLILVKPDAFARGLTGEIIARFERKGLRIVALRQHDDRPRSSPSSTTPSTRASRSSASSSSSSPPARSSRWCSRATTAVTAARQVIGATNPLEAAPGSIRGDFAHRGRPEHGPRLGLRRVRRRARSRLFFPS